MPTRRVAAHLAGRTSGLVLLAAATTLAVAGCTATTSSSTDSAVGGTGNDATSVSVTPASISITPANSAGQVMTTKPVTVAADHGTLTAVRAHTRSGKSLSGAMTPDSAGWHSTGGLLPNTHYVITARAKSTGGATVTKSSRFTTVTPSSTVYPNVIPLSGETVGVGMVVHIFFNHPVVDKAATQRLLKVTSSKPVVGAWHWFGNNEVHYRPKGYWPAYDKVSVRIGIGGANLGGKVYGQTSRTINFSTGARMVTYVSNATKELKTYRDGHLVKTVPVSLGTPDHPSVSGTMLVMTVEHNHVMDSSTYGVPADSPGGYRTNIEWALRLTNSGQFLHSAPWSVGQQGNTNVSHGCININTEAAGWFYANSHRGDVVQVSGTGHQIQPGDGWTDWRFSWAQWKAGSAR